MTVREHVLVTGGAGYIGSHACKALAEAGYLPVTYDSLEEGHADAVQWGPLEQGSTLDSVRLGEVIANYRPVAAMHFAAYINVGESASDPGKYLHNNVGGTISLARALVAGGVDKLVFSSTCAVYGVPQFVPLTEAHPHDPINVYGLSKSMAERSLLEFERAHGLRSMSLRYFNACGADAESTIGERHDPETHLIPLALRAAAGTGAPLTVFGDDYPTPDGTCIRDYIHVADLASAHVRALELLRQGDGSGAFNLGNGVGYSVMEVIESVERVTGRTVPRSFGPRRAGDPPRLLGDASAFMALSSWRPAWRELDAIVESAWRWEQRTSGQ